MAKLTAAEKKALAKLLANMSEEDIAELIPKETKQNTRRKGNANFELGPRPNNFEGSADAKKHKKDVATDKKLWGENDREERSKLEKIQAECTKCNAKEYVHPQLAYYVSEDKKSYFTCEDCMRKMKR